MPNALVPTNAASPLAVEQTMAPPTASVAIPSANVEGLSRDHFSTAGDAVKNAADHVAAGLKRPFERIADKAATSAAVAVQRKGNSSYLSLIEPFHSVFLVNNSALLDDRSWVRTRTVLAQLLPLAVLHSSEGVDVLLTNGVSTRLTNEEHVGQFLRRLELADDVAEPGAMTGQYLQGYSRLAQEQGMKPLNLIVLSDTLPAAAVTQALDTSVRDLTLAQNCAHGVRLHFCVTEPDVEAATRVPLSDAIDVTAVTAAVEPQKLAEQVLVGKIGIWAQQAVVNKSLD